jgi:hypothetical protein
VQFCMASPFAYMARDIYMCSQNSGMNRIPRSIYGSSQKSSRTCACSATVAPVVGLETVLSIVSTLEYLVREFFKPIGVTVPLQSFINVSTYISVSVGIRLIWKNRNPGVYFDRTDNIHRLQIKTIYLEMNREADWKKDVLYSLTETTG